MPLRERLKIWTLIVLFSVSSIADSGNSSGSRRRLCGFALLYLVTIGGIYLLVDDIPDRPIAKKNKEAGQTNKKGVPPEIQAELARRAGVKRPAQVTTDVESLLEFFETSSRVDPALIRRWRRNVTPTGHSLEDFVRVVIETMLRPEEPNPDQSAKIAAEIASQALEIKVTLYTAFGERGYWAGNSLVDVAIKLAN